MKALRLASGDEGKKHRRRGAEPAAGDWLTAAEAAAGETIALLEMDSDARRADLEGNASEPG
jgi:hypothetical protein